MTKKKVAPKRVAKCIDLILEFLVMVYERENKNEPTADNANNYVGQKLKNLQTWDFTYAHNIAKDLGYIKYIMKESPREKEIKEFRIKPKGLLIFLNGGHLKIIKRDIRQKWFIRIVQIAAIVGGGYYLISIGEKIFSWVCGI